MSTDDSLLAIRFPISSLNVVESSSPKVASLCSKTSFSSRNCWISCLKIKMYFFKNKEAKTYSSFVSCFSCKNNSDSQLLLWSEFWSYYWRTRQSIYKGPFNNYVKNSKFYPRSCWINLNKLWQNRSTFIFRECE